MDAGFEVAACHGDHAGKAHVTVTHVVGGVEVSVRYMPFDDDTGETTGEEQARILAQAARVAREAAAFLEAECTQRREWPTRAPAPGASPKDGERPNLFGQPAPRT